MHVLSGRSGRLVCGVALAAGGALAGGCASGTVELGFDPQVGASSSYRIEVSTDVARATEGAAPEERRATEVITADQRVTAVDDQVVVLEVLLAGRGDAPRRSTVRLDRFGTLTGIEAIEGFSSEALGLVGLDRLVPTTAAPSGELAPGTSWSIREEVTLVESSDPVTLEGSGRLDRLGDVDGRQVAVTTTELVVPLRFTRPAADTTATVDGEQRSVSTVTSELDGGAVHSASTVITGEADVVVAPPAGVDAAPVPGAISYRIEIDVERTD